MVCGRPRGDNVIDAVRLAIGTLTILPVGRPRTADPRVASWAMTLAPLIGAVLAIVPAGLLIVSPGALSSLLSATLAVAMIALLTRGIHLDGLADTADGLGSGRPAADALDIMRKSDIGPFGVVTLVLTLLVQVSALAPLAAEGSGPPALVVGLVVSRLVLPLVCSRGVPSARPDGLGHLVVGSVGRPQAVVALGLAGLVLAGTGLTTSFGAGAALALLGLVPGLVLAWWCVRRLGGITGDVLGGCVEVTFTATLVVLTLV